MTNRQKALIHFFQKFKNIEHAYFEDYTYFAGPDNNQIIIKSKNKLEHYLLTFNKENDWKLETIK